MRRPDDAESMGKMWPLLGAVVDRQNRLLRVCTLK
jgi:hypothetical protein